MPFIQLLNKIDPSPLLYGQKSLWLKRLQENNFKIPQSAIISYELLLDQLSSSFPFLKESKINPSELIQNLPKIQNQIAKMDFNDNTWKELKHTINQLQISRFAIRISTNMPNLDQFFPSLQNEREERVDAIIKNYYLKLFSPEILNQALIAGKNPVLSIQIQGMLYGTVAGSISQISDQIILLRSWKTSDKLNIQEYILDQNGQVLNQSKQNIQTLDHLLYPSLLSNEDVAHLSSEFVRTRNIITSNTELRWIKAGQEFWIVDIF